PKAEPKADAKKKLPESVDTTGLDPAEVKILTSILAEQFDPCGKARSFLESVQAGDCALASRLVRFISHKQQQGYGKRRIVALLLREVERLNTVVKVSTKGAPSMGPATSKVDVVIFSDFQCPFCRRMHGPLKSLQAHYGVRIYYKHYPLRQTHEYAEGAARAAWAAQQQGKFWLMHDTLFDQDDLKWSAVKGYAKKIGLDMKRFIADVKDAKSKDAVEQDYQDGQDAQVDGTPTFFVNGRRAETLEQLQSTIREQLGLAGVKKIPGPLELGEVDPGAQG
ncbi:MAG TPA: hypothetical protein DCQ06_02910, partial [Myxococcales bacterium]|nr:hypothetical protein [Myxococcales bacterium]